MRKLHQQHEHENPMSQEVVYIRLNSYRALLDPEVVVAVYSRCYTQAYGVTSLF